MTSYPVYVCQALLGCDHKEFHVVRQDRRVFREQIVSLSILDINITHEVAELVINLVEYGCVARRVIALD